MAGPQWILRGMHASDSAQFQFWRARPLQQGDNLTRLIQFLMPLPNQLQHHRESQFVIASRILFQIHPGQLQQRLRRTTPILLHMHKRTGKLNQSFVEIAIRSTAIRQPKFLQNIVRLVEQLPVEAIEVTQVVGVEFLPLERFNPSRDVSALFAHAGSLKSGVQSLKPETQQPLFLTLDIRLQTQD